MAEDGEVGQIHREAALVLQPRDDGGGQAGWGVDHAAAVVADDVDVLVLGGAVARSAVAEVGVGDQAEALEQLYGAVDRGHVHIGEAGRDLLRGGVTQRAHGIEHALALRGHAQPARPQRVGQVRFDHRFSVSRHGSIMVGACYPTICSRPFSGRPHPARSYARAVTTAATVTMVVGVLGRGIVAADEPVVRADDLGLARGDGCFESCRVLTDAGGRSVVERLDAHLRRLQRSLDALAIAADVPACRALVELVAEHWAEPGEAVVKVMVTRGVEGTGVPTVVATVRPIGADAVRQRQEGVRAITLTRGTGSDAFTDAPWLLGGVKVLSYALNMAALREAVLRGAEDVVWIAGDGTVLEAPTATVVWARDSRLVTTPTGASGILAGTTMAALFEAARRDGHGVAVESIRADQLESVDGIWLVSAVRGAAEVVQLDGRTRLPRPDLTRRLNGYAGF